MQYTTIWTQRQIGSWLGSRLHTLALVSLVLAVLLGHCPEASLGWLTCPPQVIELPGAGGRPSRVRLEVGLGVNVRAGWVHWRRTWVRALARSELLAVMWLVSSGWLPGWVVVLPWLEWLREGVSVAWPWLGQQPEMRLVGMYAWGRSSYRRTAQALGVRSGRIYQWVSTFGRELLPVAALFGVVRCSGVVGIDEKWVRVPEKAPRGSGRSKKPKPRRWMYVYFAVDVYTYDLLHIAIYAHNSAAAIRAFLLALRAKGYKPRVLVTDLQQQYGPAIQEVFPHARHHECIFHALQWMHRQLQEVYGPDYAQTHPEAVWLKEKIDALFQVKTRRTAEKRYAKVMALREDYAAQRPKAASVFDTLEWHWPTLVNGIESEIIPRTNNAVELVIRRFDQHYQNFCGFERIETARLFLGAFEKVYRFTPFTEDAQPRIRGKCPLELAGYDISKLPMTQVCRGWALTWPTCLAREVVPNA